MINLIREKKEKKSIELSSASQVHEFLLYLLNYFYWFFETMNNASSKHEQQM